MTLTQQNCTSLLTGASQGDFRQDQLEQMSVTSGREEDAPTITSGSEDTIGLLTLDAKDLKRYTEVSPRPRKSFIPLHFATGVYNCK